MQNDSSKIEYAPGYKKMVLAIFTGVLCFNFVDRYIITIVQEDIKAELSLSDTQLGMLTGLAFALFYATLGIPIARIADKYNRRNVVAVCLTIWSGMTALSGFALNYTQLFLARIGVGIGEGGASPPIHSMLSDLYVPEKRAKAIAIYSSGLYLGIFIAYLLGGWINAQMGWRNTLIIIGLPGVIYAVVVRLFVKEPPRGNTDPVGAKKVSRLSLSKVFATLRSNKTFLFLALGSGFQAFSNYGVGSWKPPILARLHQMPITEIGLWLALTSGLGGIIGAYLGGYLSDKMVPNDDRAYMKIIMWASALNLLPAVGIFFVTNTNVVIFLLFVFALLSAIFIAPVIAACHSMVSAHMRAFTSAILFFVMHLIGLGLGPVVVGMLSDYLNPTMGAEGLRYALLSTVFMAAIAIWFYYKAGQTYKEDLAKFKNT